MHVIYIFHTMSYVLVVILCFLKYIERCRLSKTEFCSENGKKKQNYVVCETESVNL